MLPKVLPEVLAEVLSKELPEVLPDVQALIAHFGMTPLPTEGTLFKATYRNQTGGQTSSAMLGLYCEDPPSRSLFHRLPVDEVWHFHAGDPLRLVLLHADGSSSECLLGPDPLRGHHVQFVVPAGTWQAGHLLAGGRYALFGCTVVPAFESAMFEGGEQQALLALYPQRAADIQQLGCADGHTGMPTLPGEDDGEGYGEGKRQGDRAGKAGKDAVTGLSDPRPLPFGGGR